MSKSQSDRLSDLTLARFVLSVLGIGAAGFGLLILITASSASTRSLESWITWIGMLVGVVLSLVPKTTRIGGILLILVSVYAQVSVLMSPDASRFNPYLWVPAAFGVAFLVIWWIGHRRQVALR